MDRSFSKKTENCEPQEVVTKASELELQWLRALLMRVGVSTIIIEKALSDKNYSAEAWRDYLFDEKGITIILDAASHTVSVFQINFENGNKTKIAEWLKPTVTRIKGEGKQFCRLDLKYWQIV